MIEEEKISKLWKLYQDGIAYQQQMKFATKIPKQVDFYEGRQWNDNEDSKELPKPVFNITKMIVRNKRASVLSSPVKLEYQASDNSDAASMYTAFAEYIGKEIKQEELDASAVLDGAIKGTYCYHYYWNAEARGLSGYVEGGIAGEVIDPMNIYFANPVEKDEQKQEWIIIAHRVPISAVKELAERGVADMSLLVADDSESQYNNDTEPEKDELCTVLTRYFRIEGEVYFEKAIRGTMLHAPRPINPHFATPNGMAADEDGAEAAVPDIDTTVDNGEGKASVTASLYPIAVGTWDERCKCMYGISEVEGVMPNQKIINYLIGLYILAVQNVGWGKYIVIPEALGEQVITNSPGQVLVDHSKTGNGIKRLQEPPLSPAPINLATTMVELTRSVTGSSEVMTGEQITGNMSGAAIAQLQAQAQKPIEEMRQRFWRVREKIGKIYEQFFKLYYDTPTQYTYQGQDKLESAYFNGAEYANISFSCTVEAGVGSQFSEPMTIANLERLLDKGIIDAKTFIKQYPKGAMPNRAELLKAIEEAEQSELVQAAQIIEQLKQQLAQYVQYVEQNQQAIDGAASLIAENERLKKQLIEMANMFNQLQTEATEKINIANQELMAQSAAISEYDRLSKGGGEYGSVS